VRGTMIREATFRGGLKGRGAEVRRFDLWGNGSVWCWFEVFCARSDGG
jgi:hypothetical protein